MTEFTARIATNFIRMYSEESDFTTLFKEEFSPLIEAAQQAKSSEGVKYVITLFKDSSILIIDNNGKYGPIDPNTPEWDSAICLAALAEQMTNQ